MTMMTAVLSKYFHFSLFNNDKMKIIWVPHCLDLSAFIFQKPLGCSLGYLKVLMG